MQKTKQMSNLNLSENARTLRKNMTKEERHLWYDFLSKLSVPARKQKVIGKYIVDFCIPSSKLIIETDGSQHYEEENMIKDKERDEYLKTFGFKVLRYSNLDINRRFEDVCEDILKNI